MATTYNETDFIKKMLNNRERHAVLTLEEALMAKALLEKLGINELSEHCSDVIRQHADPHGQIFDSGVKGYNIQATTSEQQVLNDVLLKTKETEIYNAVYDLKCKELKITKSDLDKYKFKVDDSFMMPKKVKASIKVINV